MLNLELLLAFMLASLVLNISPGPDMMLTLTRGVTQGFVVAFMSVLGTFFAGFLQIPLVVLGLAETFRHSPELFSVVKFAGASYLAYLGIRALLHSVSLYQHTMPAARSGAHRAAFIQGFTTNLLNPKVFLFMTAFLPQFTDPEVGPLWQQLLTLAVISKALGFVVYVGFAAGASSIGGWLTRNAWFAKLQEGILGAVMLTVAGFLFFDRSGPVTAH
ncbi:LysE family translocator [Micromonospora sp. STR1s_5]|nr:LysE family translocator [Micromonospora sp. STR1s_5]